MIKTEFMRLLEKLDTITEATSSQAPNLADCRMILSDVKDIRGELEASACIEYNGELTRVQVRTVILRDTERGREFLGRSYGRRVGLPGGGYDMEKDQGDILETAIREAYEEFNLIITDVKDTGLGVWSHRDDPWVTKHVANKEDRWTGYYSYYVTSKVAGNGDNSQPEEINKWTWLPIEKLKMVNTELYTHVTSLDEAIHPSHQPRTDLGEVSYLCNSSETLRKILSRMEIQKTYVSEVRWEPGEHNGNTQRICQTSLSTSTDLTMHAYNRPAKWGFGVILDGQELSKYYPIEPYNHADHKLKKLRINKIVKLTPEAAKQYSGSLIIMLGEYSNRLVSRVEGADNKLYNLLREFIQQSDCKHTVRGLDYYIYPGTNEWRYAPFGRRGKGKYDARFCDLLPSDIESFYAWPQPFSKNGISVKELDEFSAGQFTQLMGGYTSFDEKEERIWVENNLLNFIQIPPSALAGIVLPDFFKEDYEKDVPTNFHIAWLKRFVESRGLRVEWHSAQDDIAYQADFDSNDTEDKETTWQHVDNVASDPKTILKRAVMNRFRVIQGKITEADKERETPSSVVATAAVKRAVAEHMVDLTNANYAEQYLKAIKAAQAYYLETLTPAKVSVAGGLKPKQISEIEDLLNYYVPDPPGAENIYPTTDNTFDQEFPEPMQGTDVDSEGDT